jgi:multiple sugar transport system substrate-binding protein
MKKIVRMIALITLAGALTACGKTPEKKQEALPESTSEVGTEKGGSTVIWTDSTQLEEALKMAVDGFVKENPQYEISVESFPGAERPQKLALAKQGDSLPSLFLTAYFTSVDEIHQGTIVPMTETVEEFWKDDISESLLKQVKLGEEYYMVPVYSSPQGMLYNADIFREAGLEKYVTETKEEIAIWTFDELDREILPALKEYFGGTEKYPMALYAGSEQNDSYLINLLRMEGGEVFKNGKCVAADDPNTVKALETLKKWFDSGYTNSDAATRVFVDCNADFQKQNVAISAGQFATYKNHLKSFEKGEAEGFDIRVAAVPRCEMDGNDTAAMHEYIYGFVMMNVDDQQQNIAKEFLKWLSGQQETYLPHLSSGIPASQSVVKSEMEKNPIYQSYMDAEKYIFDFTGAVPGFVGTRAEFYPAIQSCLTGNATAQEALKAYQDAANEIIKEYEERSVALH